MGTVALVCVDAALSQRLASAEQLQGVHLVEVSDAGQLQALQQDCSELLEAVFIGPECPEPLRFAQRIHALQEDIPIVICSKQGGYEQLRRAMRFAPLVGEDVTCVATRDVLGVELQRAVARTRQRRRSRAAVTAANAVLTTKAPRREMALRYIDRLLEVAPIGVLTLDANYTIIDWNRRVTEIFGETEVLTGRPVLALFPEEQRADLQAALVTASSSVQEILLPLVTRPGRPGTKQFLEVRAVQFSSHAVSPGILVILQDIAERKQAEAAVEEKARVAAFGAAVGAALAQVADLSEALKRCAEAMVEHLDAAFARIWTLAPAENVLELQASAGLYTHLDGLHARVPVGSFKIGLIARERRPHLSNDLTHDPHVTDPAWAVREGMVAFAGYPLVVEDRLVGVMGLFARHSMTSGTLQTLESVADSIAIGIERKRAEAALVQQAEDLARSNADLQQFAYVTSHDLQEPLRTMIVFSQMLTKRYGGQLDADADEFLAYIVSGAQRMQGLVDSLLAYSRVVNVDTMPFAPLALHAALRWATMNLQTIINETQADITSEELPTVRADQVQLVQLFQNLISNGIKYRRPEESPRVHISAQRCGDEWVIAVRDNGIGIPREYAERIFGVFKRLHGNDIPGTGIGLAICRGIVEKHGGRIWVDSELGQGSVFYFSLPA